MGISYALISESAEEEQVEEGELGSFVVVFQNCSLGGIFPLIPSLYKRPRSRLSSSHFSNFNFIRIFMFNPRAMPLLGEEFRQRLDLLGPTARANYDRLRQVNSQIRPAPYVDALSTSQDTLYSFIVDLDQWYRKAMAIRCDLVEAPILSLAVQLNPATGAVDFVTVASFKGEAATLSMADLRRNSGPHFRQEDVFPEELRYWLQSDRVLVLVSGQAHLLRNPPPGLDTTAYVDADDLFELYMDKGVIRPNLPPRKGDITYQMTYAFDWHHRPTSQEKFKLMVGAHNYDRWPRHRELGWMPQCFERPPTPTERFSFFCNVVGPLGFVYRLLRHGLVYGGMLAVQPDLKMDQLVSVFMRGNLKDFRTIGRGSADPLGLQTDRRVAETEVAGAASAPPPTPPYVPFALVASSPKSPEPPLVIDYSSPEYELELHDDAIEQELRREAMEEAPAIEGMEVGEPEPPGDDAKPTSSPPAPQERGRERRARPPGPGFYREAEATIQVYQVEDSPAQVRRMPGERSASTPGRSILRECEGFRPDPPAVSPRREVTFLEEVVTVSSTENSPENTNENRLDVAIAGPSPSSSNKKRIVPARSHSEGPARRSAVAPASSSSSRSAAPRANPPPGRTSRPSARSSTASTAASTRRSHAPQTGGRSSAPRSGRASSLPGPSTATASAGSTSAAGTPCRRVWARLASSARTPPRARSAPVRKAPPSATVTSASLQAGRTNAASPSASTSSAGPAGAASTASAPPVPVPAPARNAPTPSGYSAKAPPATVSRSPRGATERSGEPQPSTSRAAYEPFPPQEQQSALARAHSTADIRTRLTLLSSAQAFSASAGYSPHQDYVRPDINVMHRMKLLAKLDKDPFLLKLTGEWENDAGFDPALIGPPITKNYDHVTLTAEQKTANPFQLVPQFHRRCTFCGGSHCSRYELNSRKLNCYKYRHHAWHAYTRSECFYGRCPNPQDHHVIVCPALHSKCPRCGCRGHSERDLCNPNDPNIMACLKSDFDLVADAGFYTGLRKEQPEWGFFPLGEAAFYNNDKPVSYWELNRLPVLEGIALARAFSQTAYAAGASATSPAADNQGEVEVLD